VKDGTPSNTIAEGRLEDIEPARQVEGMFYSLFFAERPREKRPSVEKLWRTLLLVRKQTFYIGK
jgi:hypothetical protein